ARRGPPGGVPPAPERAVVPRQGPGGPDRPGAGGPAGADHRRGLRRPGEHPQGGGYGPQGGPPSALSFPLPSRGGQADLRGRSPRQEGIEEASPGHSEDRARRREEGGGRRGRRGGGGRAGILRRGARRLARGWSDDVGGP